jgi:ubiquilin
MRGSKVDSSSDNLQIKVRSSDTVTYNVELSPDFTFLELRGLVSEKAAVPAARIRLIYQGRILRDEQKMSDCGVQTDHTIHMVTQPEATSSPLPQDTNQAPTLPNLASLALPRQHLPHDGIYKIN